MGLHKGPLKRPPEEMRLNTLKCLSCTPLITGILPLPIAAKAQSQVASMQVPVCGGPAPTHPPARTSCEQGALVDFRKWTVKSNRAAPPWPPIDTTREID